QVSLAARAVQTRTTPDGDITRDSRSRLPNGEDNSPLLHYTACQVEKSANMFTALFATTRVLRKIPRACDGFPTIDCLDHIVEPLACAPQGVGAWQQVHRRSVRIYWPRDTLLALTPTWKGDLQRQSSRGTRLAAEPGPIL